jgi:uncharacterized membrane protein (DUF2068 family)
MSRKPKSDLFLLIIALFKLAKAMLFIFLGFGLLRFLDQDVVARLQSFMGSLHVDEDNHVAKWVLGKASQLTNTRLVTLSAICFFYASLDLVEGTGLYLRKRWAEYLVVILTGSFLPLEAWVIWHHVTAIKILLTLGNIIILGYLIHVIREKPEE